MFIRTNQFDFSSNYFIYLNMKLFLIIFLSKKSNYNVSEDIDGEEF